MSIWIIYCLVLFVSWHMTMCKSIKQQWTHWFRVLQDVIKSHDTQLLDCFTQTQKDKIKSQNVSVTYMNMFTFSLDHMSSKRHHEVCIRQPVKPNGSFINTRATHEDFPSFDTINALHSNKTRLTKTTSQQNISLTPLDNTELFSLIM